MKKSDWKWQQRNAIRNLDAAKAHYPNVSDKTWQKLFPDSTDTLKFQVTPYMLSQIPSDISDEDFLQNPWVQQFFPKGELYTSGHDAYDGTDNWEQSEEFPTSNLHHKYTNRVLVRFRNCLAYCNFCFEALGILEKKPADNKLFHWSDWKKSLEYIATHPDVEEVILSGGEPLLLSDKKLDRVFSDISQVVDEQGKPKIKFKRIHTRVLSHNPYRITTELTSMLEKYGVNEIAFDVAHPEELTTEFEDAVGTIREQTGRHAPLMVLHTPFIRGVNDDTDVLWELFSKAYSMNVKPYYLIHSMPHTPYADKQRISVRDGIKLIQPLWRNKSHIALPEYIIVHYDGKRTVPLELGGTPEFQYVEDKSGNPFVHFKNWKGKWADYPDREDTIK
jgi:lysine 2,3-aminomutase